jgi:hypothetical protein
MENKRKYNSSKRKKLMSKINKINNKNIFKKIFKIVKSDIGETFSSNSNGVFFNLNILKDDSIEKIFYLVNENLDTVTESTLKIEYTPYSNDDITSHNNVGPRLSNQERNLLKKITKK